MTVTMGIINKPILGKTELAKSRLQRVSKIISPHWDQVMLSNVIAGVTLEANIAKTCCTPSGMAWLIGGVTDASL